MEISELATSLGDLSAILTFAGPVAGVVGLLGVLVLAAGSLVRGH